MKSRGRISHRIPPTCRCSNYKLQCCLKKLPIFCLLDSMDTLKSITEDTKLKSIIALFNGCLSIKCRLSLSDCKKNSVVIA